MKVGRGVRMSELKFKPGDVVRHKVSGDVGAVLFTDGDLLYLSTGFDQEEVEIGECAVELVEDVPQCMNYPRVNSVSELKSGELYWLWSEGFGRWWPSALDVVRPSMLERLVKEERIRGPIPRPQEPFDRDEELSQ